MLPFQYNAILTTKHYMGDNSGRGHSHMGCKAELKRLLYLFRKSCGFYTRVFYVKKKLYSWNELQWHGVKSSTVQKHFLHSSYCTQATRSEIWGPVTLSWLQGTSQGRYSIEIESERLETLIAIWQTNSISVEMQI